jgi:hypothetical protein
MSASSGMAGPCAMMDILMKFRGDKCKKDLSSPPLRFLGCLIVVSIIINVAGGVMISLDDTNKA